MTKCGLSNLGDFRYLEVVEAAGAGSGRPIGQFEARGGIFDAFVLGTVITPGHNFFNLCRNDVFREYYQIESAENVSARR